MSDTATLYLKSSGVTLVIDMEIDLSSVSSAEILYQKPSGATGKIEKDDITIGDTTLTVTFPNDEEFFDEVGTWKLQPYLASSTWSVYGKKVFVKVREIIELEEN